MKYYLTMNNLICISGKTINGVLNFWKRQQLLVSKQYSKISYWQIVNLKTSQTVPIRSRKISQNQDIFNHNSRLLSSVIFRDWSKKIVKAPSTNKEMPNKTFLRHFENLTIDDAASEDKWIEEGANKKIGVTLEEQRQLLKRKPCQPQDAKVLKVAIIGAPNAGKSTLANQILGWRYSAVSSKVHTTRHKSIGVLTEDNTQIIFLDTPGMITPEKKKKHRLERTLLTDPHSTLFGADIIMVVVDVSEVWHRHQLSREVLKALHLHKNKQTILILNKVDLYKHKKDLMHTSRMLTEGVVAGRTDWYKSLSTKQKINLDSLFDKVESQSGRVAKTQDNGYVAEVKSSENCSNEDSSGINLPHQFKDKLTFDSNVTFRDEVERVGNIDFDKQYLSDINLSTTQQTNSMKEPEDIEINASGRVNCDLKDSEPERKSPNLMDNLEWQSYYYKKVREIGHDIEGKRGYNGFHRVFHISALDNIGVEDIKEYLFKMAKPGNWQYNESVITDLNPVEIAKMCVWEKLLDHLPKEIPYTIEIKLVLWEVDEDGLLRAAFELLCTKKRYMFNILGDGQLISKIAAEAKQELMNTFRREMSLHLIVKLGTAKKK